jgi:large subunit ribosomal protein L25
MAEITLAAEAGRTIGTRSTGRLRASGKIPGVLYGHGIEPIPLAVDARELRAALSTEAGTNALLALQVDGDSHLAMARDMQRHPVRGTVTHIDFLVVRRDEVISADVTINLVGEATELHKHDGVVQQELFSLAVRTTPGNVPSHLEVDITDLEIGSAIRVADISLPQGVTTEADPEQAVVMGVVQAAAEPVAVAEGEAAEGEAAEGAEGEGAASEGGGDASAEGGSEAAAEGDAGAEG